MKLGLSILLSVFLVGCAARNVPKDYSLDDKKAKGVVVVSLTRSGSNGSVMYVHLRSVDNEYKDEVPINDLFVSSDWKCPMSGEIPEDRPCGRLAIIELPEGSYEFYSWHGYFRDYFWLDSRTHTYTVVEDRRGFIERFEVIAGKAVYLGNLNLSIHIERAYFLGPVIDAPYNLKITDMCDRDLPLLYQKNPNITADKVVVDLLQ
jgi:hypothetical protein